jgi:hypothetical protein
MAELTLEQRVEILETRLRHVLVTIAAAPIDCTSIPDGEGGSWEGHDQFIGVGLTTEAETLLSQWDEEDAAPATTQGESAL